jgi:SAM-dependent methyltransferase
MTLDIRAEAAKFYDLQPSPFEGKDIPFYISLVPSPEASILELGCGTGRVLIPLAPHCRSIHGVDISETMISICRDKLARLNIGPDKALVEVADICQVELKRAFDFIIAPFRVFQNLETDEQVNGFFRTIHKHLTPKGSCVLNVFRPWGDEATVRRRWQEMNVEKPRWEQTVGTGRLIGVEHIARIHESKLICYPTLAYRYYEGEELKEEGTLNIAMRCYYPEEFEQLIMAHGFRVIHKWGGYNGEPYGEGPELVVQFAEAD